MYLKSIFFISVICFSIVTGCRKPAEPVPSTPALIDNSSYLQLTFTGMEPNQGGLYAILSITKENGDSVFTNRKVAVTTANQQYITEKIKLEKGGYKLSKLMIVKSSDTFCFAKVIRWIKTLQLK
jgi:hypothetical protein